jgi:predicted O-methyltransferase YrrM
MDSLATAPVADVLARLFEEAQATDGPLEEQFAEVAADEYLPVLKLLEPRLSPGALVIAENAVEQSGEYLTYVRNLDNGYRTIPLPFGDHRGNEMSFRTT